MTRIVSAASEAEVDESGRLFREYAAWLDLDLSFQGFESELAGTARILPPDLLGVVLGTR